MLGNTILKYTVYGNTYFLGRGAEKDKYMYLCTVTQRYCILESWPLTDWSKTKYLCFHWENTLWRKALIKKREEAEEALWRILTVLNLHFHPFMVISSFAIFGETAAKEHDDSHRGINLELHEEKFCRFRSIYMISQLFWLFQDAKNCKMLSDN